MSSDRSADDVEEVVEREQGDTSEKPPEDVPGREAVESVQEQVVETEATSALSEAAVDLTFAFFEAAFAIVAVVLILLTATTSFSLYTTAAGCLLFVAVFEVIRRTIKSLDKFRRALRPIE